MEGSLLRFYVGQDCRLHRSPVWEWLLSTAHTMDIRGGSAFHAMAGFGRMHMIHEERFFKLGGSLIVEVEFIVTAEERQRLLDRLVQEDLHLFYADIPASFGVLTSAKDKARGEG
jgi:uncharacterized protein